MEQAVSGYPQAEKLFEASRSKVMIEVMHGRAVSKTAIKVSRPLLEPKDRQAHSSGMP